MSIAVAQNNYESQKYMQLIRCLRSYFSSCTLLSITTTTLSHPLYHSFWPSSPSLQPNHHTLPPSLPLKGNDSSDRLPGKATLTSGLLLGRSEVLRSLRHYLRAQSQDITPSVAWRREAWKEEALDDLLWKDERGSSSINRTLEPFQRQHWENYWETGWSAYVLFLAHRYNLDLN